MILRSYQQAAIDTLYAWYMEHPEITDAPILVMPTGAGKSVVIAEMARLFFETWPEEHPRTLVIVPSKELAEQNADKLARLLPSHLTLGYYSASVGQKRPDADVIVATIGSIAKKAHVLGNIKMVIVDECHLINPNGAGQYRQLLSDLAKYCNFRVVGLTATPFRGNGVWLTDGDDPLFTAIAHEVKMQPLLDAGHLAPMVRPLDVLTRIDSSGIEISASTGDYNLHALSERVRQYLPDVVRETLRLAVDRKKWLAFTPTVANALDMATLFNAAGIACAVVTGETPKLERENLIAQFRAGELRCLITVLALATGFDVPDVDCLVWTRPTVSPVLYVQGAGRGMRPADGKSDCLWLDFSDTTERLGPLDAIRGRRKGKATRKDAPFAICDDCGAQVRPASALNCPECGAKLREEEEKRFNGASNAAVLLHQVAAKIVRYEIHKVTYNQHRKEGSPDSLRVEYWNGMRVVAREWVCLDHDGFAGQKAASWWARRDRQPGQFPTVSEAVEYLNAGYEIAVPMAIHVNESGKFPEIVKFEWEGNGEQDRTQNAA
jgi:DNA repair protein RadD